MAAAAEAAVQLLKKAGWPVEYFHQEEKKPTVVDTAQEFIDAVLLGDHMDDVIVLPDGLKKLEMENAMPKDIVAVSNHIMNMYHYKIYLSIFVTPCFYI